MGYGHFNGKGPKGLLLAMPRLGKRALTVWLALYLRLDEWVRLSGEGSRHSKPSIGSQDSILAPTRRSQWAFGSRV
jgi:hypothetical protein